MKSGTDTGSGAPVTGSVWVASPVAIITQPRWSTALVKKSPRRRSFEPFGSKLSATQVVPPWHTELALTGRSIAFVTVIWGCAVSAPNTCASYTKTSDFWQSTSTS